MKGQSQFKQLLTEFVHIMRNWEMNGDLKSIIELMKLTKRVEKCLQEE